MKIHLGAIVLALILLSGCKTTREWRAVEVSEVSPGYGIVVAAFEYVPGKSKFPPYQPREDAEDAAKKLREVGYSSFLVATGKYRVTLAVRASTETLATAIKRSIDSQKHILFADGTKLPVPSTEIINIAELKATDREYR